MNSQDQFEKARKIFRRHGGMLRMSEALQGGIHRRMLYSMLEAGVIEQLNRGLYRLTDLPPLGNPDLVSVSLKVPSGVICLLSIGKRGRWFKCNLISFTYIASIQEAHPRQRID